MKCLSLFAAALVLVGCTSGPTLQYNGVYQSPTQDPDVVSYLRFYPDHLVVTLSTPKESDLQKIKTWFNRDHASCPRGPYELDNGRLTFITKQPNKTQGVEYAGELLEDGTLRLNSHSQINGNHSEYLYQFIPW